MKKEGFFLNNKYWHSPSNSYVQFESKTGIIKDVRSYDNKTKGEIIIDGITYRFNPVYRTYNSVNDNTLLTRELVEKNFKFKRGGALQSYTTNELAADLGISKKQMEVNKYDRDDLIALAEQQSLIKSNNNKTCYTIGGL
jgi:hypothetical protein